ncbi:MULTISPECIES: hypothetical protein [Acinetobacter]|uniref:hypothetical protein n=1 Tax=Acinetobacter TaxID=469 RepID=UPI0015DB6B91|nr:hypothetical protein [Acinetobacter bereziniae]
MNLSSLIIDSYIQKFYETENFCSFSLPHIFKNGTPAILNASRRPNGNIELTDNGMNIQAFSDSIIFNDFNAIDKVKEFTQEFKNIQVVDQALVGISNDSDLIFDLLDYSDILRKMIDFNPKHKSNNIDVLLSKLRIILEKEYASLEVNPRILGRSGEKYKFSFGSENKLIDFSEVNKNKTNHLLRKYIDTQTLNSELKFMVILDDLENDKYKSEQRILSDFAQVKPLSKILS